MIQSGMIELALLNPKLERTRESSQEKLGETLLPSGVISEHELKAIVVALKMIRRSLITFDQACQALRMVSRERFPYQAAFAKARWENMRERESGLGVLLMDAGQIKLDELGWGLALSIDETEVLGSVLTRARKIEPRVRFAAIEAIMLTKGAVITYKHAVALVRAAARTGLNLQSLLGLKEAPLKTIGKEFVLKGKLLPEQLADIVEETLQTDILWSDPLTYDKLVITLKQIISLTLEQMKEQSLPLNKARASSEDLLLSESVRNEVASINLPINFIDAKSFRVKHQLLKAATSVLVSDGYQQREQISGVAKERPARPQDPNSFRPQVLLPSSS